MYAAPIISPQSIHAFENVVTAMTPAAISAAGLLTIPRRRIYPPSVSLSYALNGSPARIGAVAASPDATFEAVASGHGVVLLAEGNTTVYRRPGIVYRPVVDLEPCQLAIARRRDDRRGAVRDLVKASMSVATQAEHDRVRQTHEDVSGAVRPVAD
jgi:hypothetical protein